MLFFLIFYLLDAFSGPNIVSALNLPSETRVLTWICLVLISVFFCVFKYKFFLQSILRPVYFIPFTLVLFPFIFSSILNFNGFSFGLLRQFLTLLFIFALPITFAYIIEKSFLLQSFLNYIPILNSLFFILTFFGSFISSSSFVYSTTLPYLATYISYRQNKPLLVLFSILTILLSAKKSLIIGFIVPFAIITIYILSKALMRLFSSFKFKAVYLSLFALVVVSPFLFNLSLFSSRNEYNLEILSTLFAENISLTTLFDSSTNVNSPLFLPIYQFTSGRSTEYAYVLDLISSNLPLSLFLGFGAHPPIPVYNLQFDTTYLVNSIHSSFLSILCNSGLFGLISLNVFYFRFSAFDTVSALVLIAYLTFGLLTSIFFDVNFFLFLAFASFNSSLNTKKF